MIEGGLDILRSCGAALLRGARRLTWAGIQRWLRRLGGLGVVVAFVLLLAPLWHPAFGFTSLVQFDVGSRERTLPVLRGQPIAYLVGGYDGQYYAQLACDPSLRTPELAQAIDNVSYRARRILLPAVAWAAAAGDPVRAFRLYPWINVLCWFLLAGLLWRLFAADDSWAGLVAWGGVVFSAGVMASVRFALTDLPSLVLFVFAMQAADRGRSRSLCGWLATGLLARETMLAGVWGLVRTRWRDRRGLLRTAGWIALALVPLLAWLVYVRVTVDGKDGGTRNFAWPGLGFYNRWRELCGMIADPQKDRWLVWTSVLGMVSMTAQIVFVLVRREWSNAWWRVAAGFVVLSLLLGDAVWEGFPGAALRVLLPLLLACYLLALSARWRWVWLLLFSVSVVVMLREFNPWRHDVTAVGSRASALVMDGGPGCYGPERRRWDCWVWTQREAAWRVQAWGRPTKYVLTGRVRSIDEREVALFWGEQEIWRGPVGREWAWFRSAPITVAAGPSEIRIAADRPAIIESPNPDARSLSACFLNVEFEAVGGE